ncbi:profilin-4-like isoform X5 [Brachionus plicatilis]|uniref:Profilin n=1 Tax=Brachionus plicatilis TaxID=10195 RepID=A0A3M7QDJ5_BRAPC|nr:profilin-4-like isoform X5 [Brachionus plicatilis]
MNQLQNLLHDALISTQHIDRCALLNKDDYSVKASSVGFQMHEVDIEVLIDAFQNTNLTRDRGIYFDESNYACLRSDDKSIYAKDGSKGLVLAQTEKYILMATYKENMFASVCVEALEKLAEYFRQKSS